jgi:membrane fusion protein (multidrug efflux system)
MNPPAKHINFPSISNLSSLKAMAIAVTLVLLSACGKNGDAPKAAPPPVGVAVVKIAPQQVPILVDVVGRTEGSKEVEVRSRVTGIVQKQLYSEGETVRANAPLFQIERAPFDNALAQAKAAAAQDNAKLEQTQRESARLQPLLAKKAISQREADDAASTLKQAEAAVLSSAARVRDAELNLSYTSVPAPISGITGRSQRSEGSLVVAGSESSLLTTLTQTDPLWVRFSLSETEYALVRGNAAKRAQVKIITPDDKEYAFKGKLNFSGSTVDSKIGTVQLRAEFANPDLALLPGQFVRTQVVAGMQEAIVVPQHAVFQNDQGRFVWVIGPESKATQRKVEAGSWVGRDWIIKSGLKPDDLVIVDNLVKMRPGTLVKVETPAAPAAVSVPAPVTTPAPATSPTDAAKTAAPAAKN